MLKPESLKLLQKIPKFNWRAIVKPAGMFAANMAIAYLFMMLFGQVNVLPGVAIAVGVFTLPVCDYEVKPVPFAAVSVLLFVASGLLAALAFVNLWVGLIVNFTFIFLIMLLSSEPAALKSHITFVICYIFCLMAPVTGRDLLMREIGLAAGAVIMAAISIPFWYKRNNLEAARTIREQVKYCFQKDREFILRMAIGISLAIFIGMALGLKKPVWIGIAVMSLTQIDTDVTLERIKHRTVATFIGAALFFVIFVLLVPENYRIFLIFFLGYLGSVECLKPYKYQQVINTMNALNASLIVLDSAGAIVNRILCLCGAIVIVLCLSGITGKLKPYVQNRMHRLKTAADSVGQ